MDAVIARDIADCERSSTLPWMRRAVTIRQSDNPYLIPQFHELNQNEDVVQNPIGKVFTERQNVVIIDFPETGKPEETGTKSDIAQFLESKDFNLGLTEVNAAFDLESKSSKMKARNRVTNAPRISGYREHYSVAIEKLETGCELIEPILCTGFLYSMRTQTIMSEMWNFHPKEIEHFLLGAGLDAQACKSVTFEVDPVSTLIGCVLVILLSRNVMQDGGHAMNDYYEHPNASSKAKAEQVLSGTFPRLCRMYQTFAFTFVDFEMLKSAEKEVMLPKAYLINRTVGETDMKQAILDACIGRFKQIPLKFWLGRSQFSDVTVRQVSGARANPFLAAINQLYARIDKLTPANPSENNGKQLLVAVSLKESPHGASMPVLTSKFAPTMPSECEFSRCAIDSANPVFNESFVMNLPYPLPPEAVLMFTIVRVRVEDVSGASEELSTVSIPLFAGEPGERDPLLISNNTHNLTVSNGDVLSIRTYLRSSLLQNNQSLVNFLRAPQLDVSKLIVIPAPLLIEYMFPILDKFIDGIHDGCKRGVEIFIDYSKLVVNTFEYTKFIRFLLAYMKFFAFRIKSVGMSIMAPAAFGNEERFSSPTSLVPPGFADVHKYQSVDGIPVLEMTEMAPRMAKSNPPSRKNSIPSDVENELAELTFPSRILWYLDVLLTKNDELIDRAAPMFDFFFAMIIKWLETEKETMPCDDTLFRFCSTFTNKAVSLSSSDAFMKSIGNFANLMFDIGRCSASLVIVREVIRVLRQKEQCQETLMKFIESVFKPRLFLFMSRNSDEFRRIVIRLVSDAYSSLAKNEPMSRLFALILQIVNLCGDDMKTSLANALMGLVEGFEPSQMVLCSKNLLVAPLVLFEFLTTKADDVPCNLGTINALHFMLKKIKEKDVAELITESKPVQDLQIEAAPRNTNTKGNRVRSGTFRFLSSKRVFQTPPTPQKRAMPLPQPKQGDQKQQEKLNHLVQFTINNVLTVVKKMATKPDVELHYLVGVLYHLLFLNDATEFNKAVLKTMEGLLMRFKQAFFQVSSPCLIKIVKRVLQLLMFAHKMRQPAEEFITAFYRVDDETDRNMTMSNIIMIRCFTLFTPAELKSNGIASLMKSMREKKGFMLIASKYDELAQDHTYIDIYAHCDYFWFKYCLLSLSPDAQCHILEEMYKFHVDGGRDIEAASVAIMQAALVLEYATQMKRFPNYFNKTHPSTVFKKFCPTVDLILQYGPKEMNLPAFPGVCDSQFFSAGGLCVLLSRVLEIYKKKNLYDLAATFMDVIWPIQEFWHSYPDLANTFAGIGTFLTNAELEMDTSDRYYKVKLHSFYEGRKEYIYRARPLTQLQEFIEHMRTNYSKTYGPENVVILSGSDAVDESKVESGVIILQITYVEAFHKKGQDENGRFTKLFYTQMPFVKGQKKAHGDVDQQWIRRYLYETSLELPNIFGRAEVVNCVKKEYSPIQYATKQLRKRYVETKEALERQNIPKLRMILKGTVSPEVNSGPKRFIEVFLSKKERTKYTGKLIGAIEMLVEQAKVALQVIAEDCNVSSSYAGLYEQLERGYEDLRDTILTHKE